MAVYRVTSPSGEVFRVTAPEGASEAQVMAYAKANMTPKAKPQSFGKSAMTALGRGTRDVLEGGAKLLGIVGDPANAIVNAATGANLGSVSGSGAQLADTLGLPRSETDGQQLISAINQGALGALVPAAGAGALAARGGGAVAQALAAQPVMQVVSGGAAGAGGELARQSGGGVLAQIGASLLGGLVPFGGAAVGRGVANTVAAIPRGQQFVERGAGQVLRDNATDAATAVENIAAREPSVSGAAPTLAEASNDPGLAGLQRSMSSISPNAAGSLTERVGNNALARQAAIDATLGEGDTAAVSGYAARQAAALESATGRNIAKVGALEPYDVSGEAARGQLESARKVSQSRVSHAYNHPDIVEAQSKPVVLTPDPFGASLPEAAANSERAAFEAAARSGLKAGDTSNKATGGITSFIVSHGGIKPSRVEQGFVERLPGVGDLYSAGVKPGQVRRGLFSQKGETLDNLLTSAQEAGFFPDNANPTVDDLVQMISDDVNGRPVYRQDDMRGVDRSAANEEADYWGRMFQNADTSPEKMTPADWDALYRDVQELPPHVMTQADAEAMGGAGIGKPVGPMQSALLGLRHDFYAGGDVDPAIERAVRNVVNTGTATVRDVTGMSSEFRRLADLSDSRKDKAFLGAAADAVDGFLRANAGPEYADALKAAQAAAREHHNVFSNGRIGEALKEQRGNYGRDATEGGNVTARLVPASDRTGAPDTRQLKTALGDAGAETVAREELRRALDKATREGGDVAAKVAKVQADYAGVLSEHPALATDIAVARQTAATHAAFLKSPLGALRDGNVDVASKVKSALGTGGNSQLHAMISAVSGDDAAMAGLRRAVAQYIVPEGESAVVTAGGADVMRNQAMRSRLGNALRRTEGTSLLDARQRVTLSKLKGELDRQQFAISSARAAGSDTSMNETVKGKLINAAIRKGLEKASSGNLLAGVVDIAASAMQRRDAITALVNKAMLDPDFAALLLSKPPAKQAGARAAELAAASVRGAGVGGATVADRIMANVANVDGMASAAASTDQTAKDK